MVEDEGELEVYLRYPDTDDDFDDISLKPAETINNLEEMELCNAVMLRVERREWMAAFDNINDLYVALENSGYPYLRDDLTDLVDIISSALEFLNAAEFTQLYSPRPIHPNYAELFIEVERRAVEAILVKPAIIDSLDPRFFEELIGSLYSRLGFEVLLTKRTRDGGRDIVAVGESANSLIKFIVECKRYRRDRKVGIAPVQRLWGVKMSEGATKAVLATTSTFTSGAKKFERQHIWELQLLDYSQVIAMLKRCYGRP